MDEKIKELRNNCEKAYHFFAKKLAYTLGPIELKGFIEGDTVNIVDVRRKEDYELGHIPNALSIPKDELSDNLDKLSKDKVTVVYSYNQECHLGAAACLLLADYEYPCMLLDGGYKVWTEDYRFAVQKPNN